MDIKILSLIVRGANDSTKKKINQGFPKNTKSGCRLSPRDKVEI